MSIIFVLRTVDRKKLSGWLHESGSTSKYYLSPIKHLSGHKKKICLEWKKDH